jgi:hypothetical protein
VSGALSLSLSHCGVCDSASTPPRPTHHTSDITAPHSDAGVRVASTLATAMEAIYPEDSRGLSGKSTLGKGLVQKRKEVARERGVSPTDIAVVVSAWLPPLPPPPSQLSQRQASHCSPLHPSPTVYHSWCICSPLTTVLCTVVLRWCSCPHRVHPRSHAEGGCSPSVELAAAARDDPRVPVGVRARC